MSQITLWAVDDYFHKPASLKTTQFLLGALNLSLSAHTWFQAAIKLAVLLNSGNTLAPPPSCQALLLNSGFLSFHGSPPTRIFPLRSDCLERHWWHLCPWVSPPAHSSLLPCSSYVGQAWPPHPGQYLGPRAPAYQGEGIGLSVTSIHLFIHLFMSLLIYLCIYYNSFIEI